MTLKFKEWNELNEANIFDKVKDWFSVNFGGALNKMENLITEYRSAEEEYIDEWGKVNIELDKLDLQKDQTKSDPAEYKKIERYVQRNQELLSNMKKSHVKKIDHIMVKVKSLINDNAKLRTYWEVNKTRVDSEIAEDMYKRSKDLADETLSRDLYNKYKDSVLKAKKKDDEFKEKYGDLLKGSYKKTQTAQQKTTSKSGISEATLDLYIAMSLSEFTKEIESLDPKERRELTNLLIKNRNELYVQMDMERENINSLISKGQLTKEEASKELKDIREKHMSDIRELRSKITISRKNA
jgi:hypothetical protein